MAKSAKDQLVNPSPLSLPPDTSKIKKHIALFCDRIGKGARLVEGMKGMMFVINLVLKCNINGLQKKSLLKYSNINMIMFV